MNIKKINGKTIEKQEKEKLEDLYIPHHIDRWYNRHQRLWVVQLKDRYDNQIKDSIYVHGKQEAINIEKELKKENNL